MASALLLALCAVCALPGTAQAQELWSGTLDVKQVDINGLGCATDVTGVKCSDTDILDDDDFTYDSHTYTISELFLRTDFDFNISFTGTLPSASDSFHLHVGDETFAFGDSDVATADTRIWNNSGLSWAVDDEVELRITRNTAASGALTITGELIIGQTLTADTSAITDTNGLDDVDYDYQWIRVEGSEETDIPGADSSTYRLKGEDLHKRLKVRVDFTDDFGHKEDKTSAATDLVLRKALVSTTGQDSVTLSGQNQVAQGFRVGLNGAEYILTSVDIAFHDDNTAQDMDVEIWSSYARDDSGQGNSANFIISRHDWFGRPGAFLWRLTNPATVSGGGTRTFTAPGGGVRIKSGYDYFVVVKKKSGGNLRIVLTGTLDVDNNEDDGRQDRNWKVGNGHYQRSNSSRSWFDNVRTVHMAVRGITRSYSSDAKLKDFEIEDANGNAIALRRNFNPDKTDLERLATVPFETDSVVLMPVPNNPDVFYIQIDDKKMWQNYPPHKGDEDRARFRKKLKVGNNDFTIKVRPEDAATSGVADPDRRYRFRIVREPDPTACQDDDIWCSTMTVLRKAIAPSIYTYGYDVSQAFGSLTDHTFSYGGVDFSVSDLAISFQEFRFDFVPVSGTTNVTVFDSDEFRLQVGNQEFSFGDATSSGSIANTHRWDGHGFSWSVGDTVPVRLFRVGGQNAPPEEPEDGPLTASLDDAPASHDGEDPFSVRIAFSEDIATSYRDLDEGFVVTGGSITSVKRVDRRSDLWQLKVAPSGNHEITLELAPGRACSITGAPCTSDGKTLSEPLTVQVPGTSGEAYRALTAGFVEQPPAHSGAGERFEVTVAFTEAISNGYRHVADAASATGGQITSAKRRDGRSDQWLLRVMPDGNGAVTVTLAGGDTCGSAHPTVLCTEDGRPLSQSISTTVLGPWALSVADAEATEGEDANMTFTVTLDRQALQPITVDYATRDGTATAGQDYTAKSGTLTFGIRQRTKTVRVAITDDDHDDDGETFDLVLSNASGARIEDGEATGTIHNSDPMPQAWIARFGRTVAEQLIDAVHNRIQASRTPGVQINLAGQQISLFGTPEEDEAASTLALKDVQSDEQEQEQGIADWVRGETDGLDPDGTSSLTMQELLSGVSFTLVGGEGAEGTQGSGLYALWGRVAESRFDGQEDEVSLDGDVTSALLGLDWIRGDVMAGLILSHSEGDGGYQGTSDQGSVTSELTGLYPWGRYQVSERLSVWGMAGYGEGDLKLDIEGQESIRTDLDLLMGAAGVVGELIQAPETGGYALAIKSDVMAVRTSTDRATGLASAEADVTRLRLGLEGTHTRIYENGSSLRPRIELGIRHDDGDAETGFGVDVGTGITWVDQENGFTGELSARTLLTHEDSDFEDTGLSASLSWDPSPSSLRGPKLTLTQTLGGSSSGGMEALLNRKTLAGLAEQDSPSSQQRQLDLSLAYGHDAGYGFTATPELGLAFSPQRREYRMGWKLDLVSRRKDSLEVKFDLRRKEYTREDTEPEHVIGLRLNARF